MFQRRIIPLVLGLRLIPSSRRLSKSASAQWKDFDQTDVVNHVENIFLCSQPDAAALIESAKETFRKDRDGRIEILRALRKKGFNINHVKNCKIVLKLPLDLVRDRIKFCSKVLQDETPACIVAVLRLSEKDYNLTRRLIMTNHPKLEEMSNLLKLSKVETCQYFVKHPFLIRSKASTLKSKLDLVSEKRMSLEDVKKDLWILTYTKDRLVERIEQIEKFEISPMRPWMLRCLPEVLMRTYNYRHENLTALAPHPSLHAFLADRLGVTEEQIQEFAKKYPPVMRVQVAKIKEIIDYLVSEGYNVQLILRTPRILCHSLTTIQSRINVLKERNYKPRGLSVLCKSKRSFDIFVRKVDQFNEESENRPTANQEMEF